MGKNEKFASSGKGRGTYFSRGRSYGDKMVAGVASIGRLHNSELCTLRSSSPIVDVRPIDKVIWKMP
ncbi:conserved hypothetical protein [Ricinus communis]|uniref:Uncharacterized protein n=1 Tax=Ricinus communis TaxID=3988 RepID=B9SU89_RICCO|nr:conserved hypothetical protein [Ricinus communis]